MSHRYHELLRLAESFEEAAGQLRAWSRLGQEVLTDPEVATSAALSRSTWDVAEESIRRATGGRDGLLARSAELDADALVVRATVATYEWIDGLQEAATRTLGSIAGRAVGFLAPGVELGGAVVGAGLIETDALDRDEVADFLGKLADQHPELLDHLRGGSLLDDARMRSLLTIPTLAADDDARLATAGLRAVGVEALRPDAGEAVRDVAAALAADFADDTADDPVVLPVPPSRPPSRPRTLGDLMTVLAESSSRVLVREVAPSRFIAYVPGPHHDGVLRLVTGDPTPYAAEAAATIESAVGEDARVMLVGAGLGGTAAAQVAAGEHRFVVDHLVTVGSPAAQVARLPASTQVLSLEDRDDPVALLGALVTGTDRHRLTVVFDGTELDLPHEAAGHDGAGHDGAGHDGAGHDGAGRRGAGHRGTAHRGTATGERLPAYVDGARAADVSSNPVLREAIQRMVEQGYLGG